MTTLNFRIETLEWAASNASMTLKEVVSKISKSTKTQELLLTGTFSVNQAETFAKITKIPFGTLFLDKPPQKLFKPEIPDLRQKQNAEPLSEFFYEMLMDVQNKQEWYIDFLKKYDAEKLKFVGKFKGAKLHDVKSIAEDIRSTLNIANIQRNNKNRTDYLKILIERCEDAGILVFKNSIVKNTTRKPLDLNEFRGFVLLDHYAPAIFLNSRDAPSALIFTLAHELAHVWLGNSGVDDLDLYGNDRQEVLCNKIAAEVLIPSEEFLLQWGGKKGNLVSLSDYFFVSKLTVARVAYTHGKITKKDYQQMHHEEYQKYNLQREEEKGAPSFITLLPGRNSKVLTKTVVNQALAGNILLRDAGKLLNVSPQNILKLGGVK